MLWYALGRLYVFCASVALRAANFVPHGSPSVCDVYYTKNKTSAASRFIHKSSILSSGELFYDYGTKNRSAGMRKSK